MGFRRYRLPAIVAGAFLFLALPAGAQERGTVTGTVLEELSTRPLVGVQVFVPNTEIGTVTGAGGRYTLTDVPAGQVTIRAQIIGYRTIDRAITLGGGMTERVDFTMAQTAIALDEVVVTGAGIATQKRKLGNTVATINTQTLENAPIRNLSELLTAREPGVASLASGGMSGEGARIRIRGSASLSQLNQPIVYVDGVRVANGGGFAPNVGTGGGGSPSRLDDINPQSIERVEILKGAAAATLYGTEASSGVIQIFTKKGASGAPRYELNVEQSISRYPENRYVPNAGFARDAAAASKLASHWGIPGLQPFQVFEVPLVKELYETGTATTTSLSVSGGSSLLTYFISGRISDEDGPFGGNFWGDARDVDEVRQANANLTIYPIERLKVRINSMYTERYHETPENNNNIYGTISSAIMAKPERANCDLSSRDTSNKVPGFCTGAGNAWGNPAFITTREALQSINNDDVRRFAGSVGATYDLMGVNLDGTFGVDIVNQRGISLLPFRYNVDSFTGANVLGFRGVGDENTRNLTGDFKASWNWLPNETFSFQTILGAQGFFTERTADGGSGTDFPGPGVEILSATANRTGIESFVQTAQLGVFGQEQIGYNDWAFLTFGGRYDKHSAFGETAGGVFYPKVSLSVVPSDALDWTSETLSSVRVRGAIGQSGRQPSAFAKFTTYSARSSETGAGLGPSNLGNPDLKPEVSTEWEGGAELGLFNDRIGFEATYWNRTVTDVLIERQFAVSGGFIARQLDNIGELKAHGIDLSLRGLAFSAPNFQVNLHAGAAFLNEEVTDMGGAPPLKSGGSYPRYRNFITEGFAPGSFFGPKLRQVGAGLYQFDQDGDCEADNAAAALAYFSVPRSPDNINVLVAGGDPRASCKAKYPGDFLGPDPGGPNAGANYLGKPQPDWQGSFGADVTIMNNVRLASLFEFKAGDYYVHDLTTAFRRSNPSIGRNVKRSAELEAILLNPASTAQQRVDAAQEFATTLRALSPYDGLNEIFQADYVRWRELSLTYSVPAAFAERLGARSLAITAAGRNIALWTKYPGADPDLNAIGVSDAGGVDNNFLDGTNAFGVPLPARWSLAARVVF